MNGRRRHPRVSRSLALVAVALACGGVAPAASAQTPWPTTDWKIDCYTPSLQEWLAPDGSGDLAAHAAYEDTVEPYVQGESCNDTDAFTATGRVRQSLRHIGQWLERQGFPPPNVPLVNGRFEAVFVPPDAQRVCYGGQCADERAFYAYMGSPTANMLVVRTEEDQQAHELFHAVQYAYAPFQNGTVANWVQEGTAEAVGRTWSKVSAHRRLSTRDFSRSLHGQRPPVRAYDDEAFWRAVSREYTTGETYEHLVALFDKALTGDELAAVDETFREELRLTDGLAEAYRQVVARHLDEKRFYDDCPRVPLRPHADSLQKKVTVPRFDEVAAMCWEIDLEGFEQDVILAVTASYRPGTEALVEQLTAVMADQSGRVDRAEVRTVADVPEATWYYDHLGGADPTIFLLTNVADQPDATRGLANLSVTFTALESNAVVSVSGAGDSGGSGGSSGFPLGDPTLGFEATRWWFGVHTSDEIAAATPVSQSLPPGNACQVQLTLAADDVVGDEDVSVTLMGWLPAPLAPGAWPVGKYQFEDRLGELYADVAVPCQFGGCGEGHKYRMVGFHGELEFTDVSRSHVAGRFDITAGAGEQYAGVGLSGIYSVTLGGPAGAGEKTMRADHPCAPAPPDSKPGAAGGNGADDVGDGQGEEPDGNGNGDPGTEEEEQEEEQEEEENGPQGAGGAPGEADPGADPGATGEAGPAGDQEADEAPPEENPEARSDEARVSELILGFPPDGRSVLRSEPQTVQGTGSVTGVALASRTYDLTVALPVFGCTVEMGDASAAEQFQLALAHDRWLKSGRTLHGLVLFDFTTAELRLDATSGGVTLDLESAEGGVTMLGTAENAVSLRAGGPTTIVGNVSDATLEVTRGDDTFSCAEPMAFSFTVARMD